MDKELKFKNFPFECYLGKDKRTGYKIFLNGFSWDCNWYYGGGYLSYYNRIKKDSYLMIHTHFDIVFLKQEIKNSCAVWENLDYFVDDCQFNDKQWWRVKDLYKQFYSIKNCAEVFKYGGHCTSEGRSKEEINIDMNYKLNLHLQDVIIPEIMKVLNV